MYTGEEILLKTILIVAVVIGAILLCFLFAAISQHRKFRSLSTKKLEDGINTLEDERKRIASDMHDDLGPVLSATKLKLESVDTGSVEDRLQVQKCIGLLDEMVNRIRYISNGLMPNTLVQYGIVAALNEFIAMIPIESGLKISFHCGRQPNLSGEAAIHLFRMLQEIIHNTVKHAKAQNLQIKFLLIRKNLHIFTADDGVGFIHHNSKENSRGHGLNNLYNRVAVLSGEIGLQSAPGEGTSYNIVIPLNNLKATNDRTRNFRNYRRRS
jgi:signal transduction histidine kinase